MRNVLTASGSSQGFSSRVRLVAASVMLAAAAAAAALTALPVQADGHHGRGMGGHGGGMMMFGGSPERIGRGVDRMLDGLNASDAQRAQIKQIATAAAADLNAQREAGRGLRERGAQLLTAPTVDAIAAEALRKQMLVQHDQVSQRVLRAMLDVSSVLTPEQRAKVGERIKQRQVAHQERMQRMQREPARN